MICTRLVALASGYTLAFFLLSAVSLPAQAQLSTEQQLIAADRDIFEAMTGPHPNTAKLASALAPEYCDVEQGEVESRDKVMKDFAQLADFTFAYERPRAVVVSPTAGYVIADVRYSYSFIREHRLTTTAFVLRQGRWLATLHTEMPAAHDREDILATPADTKPEVIAMRRLALEVMSQVHVPGYGPFPFYPVFFDAGTAISYSDGKAAHEADFSALPSQVQQVWTQWATYTTDESSGEALFHDMFYRFFLVHELGHLISGRVIAGLPEAERTQASANMHANAIAKELAANRVAVAWFREHDPQYLAQLVGDFRRIEAHLPNPVPAGVDPKHYFTQNYLRLASDPVAYGWYQLYMVISVYDESPKSFQQIMEGLPQTRYNED